MGQAAPVRGGRERSLGRRVKLRTAAFLIGLAGCAAAGTPGQIPPVQVANARPSPVALPGALMLPPGPGPHPVVILLHGCSGVSANTHAWADRLLSWGYGSLILDSLQPRSVATVCAPGLQPLVTRFDRAGDTIAAARWLQSQPGVDGGRIAVLGESHGGGTAATLISRPFTEAAGGLIKGAVDYYGPCRDPNLYAGLPFLALAGTADTWGNPARTCKAYEEALPQGSPVSLAIYPSVVHAFDNPRNVQLRWSEGHPMQYDAAAASDSYAKVHAFLDEVIGPAG